VAGRSRGEDLKKDRKEDEQILGNSKPEKQRKKGGRKGGEKR